MSSEVYGEGGGGERDRVSSGNNPGALKTLDSVSTIIGMSRRKTKQKKKTSSKSKVGTEPKETESKN